MVNYEPARTIRSNDAERKIIGEWKKTNSKSKINWIVEINRAVSRLFKLATIYLEYIYRELGENFDLCSFSFIATG